MMCHGDELGCSQGGNNNGFCQDNETTWIGWDKADAGLIEFTASVSALRATHPVFRRRQFFSGRPVRRRGRHGRPDISWFKPDGSEMTDDDWDAGFGKAIAVYLNGLGIPDRDTRGQRVADDSFILCFNAHDEPIDFTLPPRDFGLQWHAVLDTAGPDNSDPRACGTAVTVESRAMVVLQAALNQKGQR